MEQVHWLEQEAGEVPGNDDWLTPFEHTRLDSFRIHKRRQDWRLGRWTAKQAIAAFLGRPCEPATLSAIEIRPAESGAPEAFVDGRPAAASISISHRQGRAACAVAQPHIALGCDLEVVEPRTEAFLSDYFTDDEQQIVAQAHPAERFRVVALLWSAKESALKAMKTGLRMDVRSISVGFGQQFALNDCARGDGDWRTFRAVHMDGVFAGWWRSNGCFVRTMISAPESGAPAALRDLVLPQSPVLR